MPNPIGMWKKNREVMWSIQSHTLGKDSRALCRTPGPRGKGEGWSTFLAEESPSRQPHAKARLRPDPGTQQ